MLIKFFKMLYALPARDRLPRRPSGLRNEIDGHQVDPEHRAVLRASAARDPRAVEKLMDQYDARDARDLLAMMPSRYKRPDPRKRFMNWLRRLEGTTEHEPVLRSKKRH